MEVVVAETLGFCWGVERAIDMAKDFADKGHHPVYTDGPLIHNKQMMATLTEKGVREVGDYQSQKSLDDEVEEGTKKDAMILVRAHGISPERRQYLKSLGLPFKDATCPDVGIIAGKIRLHTRKGFHTIIFGDPKHPEVIGLMGYTEGKGHAVQTVEDVEALENLEDADLCMVSQTTMFTDDYDAVARAVLTKFPQTKVLDTICGATKDRQGSVLDLVKKGVEAVVVIGGRHSANTCKLVKLVERQNLPAFHVETAKDLDPAALASYTKVGVTAGASTPPFMIQEVCDALAAL